jgi:transketolase
MKSKKENLFKEDRNMEKNPAVEDSAMDLDEMCINTLRFLAVDAVEKANSGHPGLPMGAAAVAYVLWTKHLKYNPADPEWLNRDRFVLSAGHGSMLLYGLLHLTGFDLSLEQIKQFRQWGSRTPGHPERTLTHGVEVTTGPLGQGFGNGVGMAIAQAHLAARYNRPGFDVIDHKIYGIVSDGDLMEGVASEAASLAGHLRLGRLIYLYDDNHVSLAAATDITFTEDRARRFEAYGWHTESVEDGNDLDAIDRALRAAEDETSRPSLILVRTHLGYGSPNKQDTYQAHGSPLGEEEVKLTKQNLGWPLTPSFYIPEEALHHFRKALIKGKKAQAEWDSLWSGYSRAFPDLAAELSMAWEERLPQEWDKDLPFFSPEKEGMKTRVASGKVMSALSSKIPLLLGGSADLDPSTHTALKGKGDFENSRLGDEDVQGSAGGGWNYSGVNLHFGVREHAMGAILNGLATYKGVIPFGATFLIFSDYMRPAIRLAALMELHVIFVFTHDSIALGEDGPTHQPVEQLAGLRAIPHLVVIRPCDANETVVAWKIAVEMRNRPVALVLTRQNVPILNRAEMASAEGLRKGGYVLSDPEENEAELILIASGSEISLCLEAKSMLSEKGISARVVSLPSWELFQDQPREYRDSVLPPAITARLGVEAASPQGWHRFIGERGQMIAVARFGASAPGQRVMEEYGLTAKNIYEHALSMARKK